MDRTSFEYFHQKKITTYVSNYGRVQPNIVFMVKDLDALIGGI